MTLLIFPLPSGRPAFSWYVRWSGQDALLEGFSLPPMSNDNMVSGKVLRR